MLIVGLTGGIGCGKSTVAKHFAELGVPVIDADVIAHELVEPGQETLEEIIRIFGPAVIQTDGRLDRKRLGEVVFKYPAQRQLLEDLMHPRIREEMQRRTRKVDASYCILVIPLLVETSQTGLVDRVLVVDTTPEIQLQRIQRRDQLSSAEIQLRLDAQATRECRLSIANDVIENSGDLDDLYRQVMTLHQKYSESANKSL
ncbi:MAG: dephospho-CoA kinase [Gammaproteobacteria bacterium]